MIIGNGDIAQVLREIDNDRFLFFVSGVSNSQETRESEYQREIDLLRSQSRAWHIVYCSSLSIFYAKSRYAEHKRRMEVIIKSRFPNYTILRLGNITWGDNPHTLLNFIRTRVRTGEGFPIHDVERYICDKQEFLHWVNLIPDQNCEMNIPGKRMTVREIADQIIHEELCRVKI